MAVWLNYNEDADIVVISCRGTDNGVSAEQAQAIVAINAVKLLSEIQRTLKAFVDQQSAV